MYKLTLGAVKTGVAEDAVSGVYNVIAIVVLGAYGVFAVHADAANTVCSAYAISANTDKDSVNAFKIMI